MKKQKKLICAIQVFWQAELSDIYNYLNQVKKSSNGEYFLTDIISICVKNGSKVGLVLSSEEDLIGINDREDLSKAELLFKID